MKLLSKLFREGLTMREVSIRRAAEQIGIAHTTLLRLISGYDVDLNTVIKICDWLEVKPASVLNAEAETSNPFADQIAAVMEVEPTLKETFSKAMAKVLSEAIDPETFRDIAAYSAYRIKIAEEDKNHLSTMKMLREEEEN